MGNIQYWQLATDSLLVLALLFLAIRFTRSSGIQLQGRSQDLQRGLKALIKEADKVGRGLNETLGTRQSELKALLSEIREAEERFEKFETDIVATRRTLDEKLVSANEVIQGIEGTLEVLESHANDLQQMAQQTRQPLQPTEVAQAQSAPTRSAVPEPQPLASTQTPLAAAVERSSYTLQPEPASFSTSTAAPAGKTEVRKTNIYGEPIPSETAAEKAEAVAAATRPASASLQQIQHAAEQLLRAGYDLRTVSAKTRLSIDQVRALSQAIAAERTKSAEAVSPAPVRSVASAYGQKQMKPAQAQEQAQEERPSPVFAPDEITTNRADERLGVLGSMKRDRYTV